MTDGAPSNNEQQPDTDPRPAAVTFVTTEHFTLQGARSSTIAEATGRATMFLGTVSGGLVALGLIATAGGVGAAFYAFGLILLPTLAFVGLVTFDRVLQSGVEDHGYTRRIARLRGYYFQYAPELEGYLLSVPAAERLRMQGLRGGRGLAGVPDGGGDGRRGHGRAGRLDGWAARGRRLWPFVGRGTGGRRSGRRHRIGLADALPAFGLGAGQHRASVSRRIREAPRIPLDANTRRAAYEQWGAVDVAGSDLVFVSFRYAEVATWVARNLAPATVEGRQRVVRVFAGHAAAYPWAWTPQMVDEWCTDLRTVRRLRRSTLRSYQEAVRGSGTGEGGASPCRELAEPNMAVPGAAARPTWSFRSGAGGR